MLLVTIFTSISLAQKLAKRQMTVLGTINKNKKQLPTKLTETRNRKENISIFAFQDSPHLFPIVLRRVELSSCSVLSMTLHKLKLRKSQTQNGS